MKRYTEKKILEIQFKEAVNEGASYKASMKRRCERKRY